MSLTLGWGGRFRLVIVCCVFDTASFKKNSFDYLSFSLNLIVLICALYSLCVCVGGVEDLDFHCDVNRYLLDWRGERGERGGGGVE